MTNVKTLLRELDIVPNKALGQNFISNQAAIDAIVAAACIDGKNVLEIGPGLGAITRGLAARAKKVVAVEIDQRMIGFLSSIDGIMLRHEDFLQTDIDALFPNEAFSVAANLPYYATTPICMKLLKCGLEISSMTLMLQKEAAQRFFANAGTKKYGPLTILANMSYSVSKVMELSPADYYPEPEVDSWVIKLERKSGAMICGGLASLLDTAFSMRRKTLVNNLIAGGMTRERAWRLLLAAKIPPDARAEAVSIEQFKLLSSLI